MRRPIWIGRDPGPTRAAEKAAELGEKYPDHTILVERDERIGDFPDCARYWATVTYYKVPRI